MSFLALTTLRTVRAAPVARFSTTAIAQKSPVDAAKDTLKKVDRTVSDAAVSGIEAGGTCFLVLRPSHYTLTWL